jgi:hypothetical protein
MHKLRIVNISPKVWHGATENGPLTMGQIPNFRGVRVASGTGYNHVEGNRRASRNGLVTVSPEIPNVTIRNLFITA